MIKESNCKKINPRYYIYIIGNTCLYIQIYDNISKASIVTMHQEKNMAAPTDTASISANVWSLQRVRALLIVTYFPFNDVMSKFKIRYFTALFFTDFKAQPVNVRTSQKLWAVFISGPCPFSPRVHEYFAISKKYRLLLSYIVMEYQIFTWRSL